jgi:hypothetical protein
MCLELEKKCFEYILVIISFVVNNAWKLNDSHAMNDFFGVMIFTFHVIFWMDAKIFNKNVKDAFEKPN